MPRATPLSPETDPNPTGICQCGCGGETSVVKWSDKTKGHVRGHHRQFINGHDKRTAHVCRAAGCDRPHEARGYCTMHYQRIKKHGTDAKPQRERPPLRPCSVMGCDRDTRSTHGLCPAHYQRKRKHGTFALQPHWSEVPEKRDIVVRKIAKGNTGKVRTPEHREAISRAQRGRKHTPEHIANRVANFPKTKNCGPPTAKQIAAARNARAALRSRKGPTRLEIAGRMLLDELGVEFYEQEPFGPYNVDFFIPKIGCVIEADGSYWHRNEKKERARDAYLLRNPKVRSIVHLTDEQLAPWTPTRREWEQVYRRR